MMIIQIKPNKNYFKIIKGTTNQVRYFNDAKELNDFLNTVGPYKRGTITKDNDKLLVIQTLTKE